LPVWDTHNHLDAAESLVAREFWDIGRYFWFHRELQGVGYPHKGDAMALPERVRAEAFMRAFGIGRNTMWNQALRRTLCDLWALEASGATTLLATNERIKETAADPDWPRKVCEKMNLAKLAVPEVSHNGLERIRDRVFLMAPTWWRMPPIDDILAAPDQNAAAERRAEGIRDQIAGFAAQGRRVIRAPVPSSYRMPNLAARGNAAEDIAEYLLHALFRALNKHQFLVQVFIGMTPPVPGYKPCTRAHGHYALNDPDRIAAMHPIFDMYCDCTFEIANAANLSKLQRGVQDSF